MMCKLKGKVKSGLGEASYWTKKVSKAFEEKYGMKLFLGTLNVEIENDYVLNNDEKIKANEYGGNFDLIIKECKIFERKAYIFRTEKNNKRGGDHPLNLIEVLSDINMRETYKLKDNDEIDILV